MTATTHFVGDTTVLLGRSLRHITRSLDTIITTTIMPIAFLLLFVFVLGGAINSGSDSYVNYLLPGILVITIASGVSYTAFRLFLDTQSGIFERFQSMPIARSSVLWAHVGTSLVANMISVAVVVLAAVVMGFRSGAGVLAWLAVAGILILLTLALTWIAVIPGLAAKSADGASAFSYPLILLPFISSAFVPTDTMPGPVRAFAENQPVTSIVNAIRDLLAQQPVGTDIWVALAWCLGILALFTLALTWLAVIPGLTAKSVDGASAFSYPLILLPFISSAFVPTATMPGPVRAFAENQPVTSIVDAIRDLLAGQPVGSDIWVALAWCVGLLAVAYGVAMLAYRRRLA